MNYYSQFKQDAFLDTSVFNQKRGGVFIEVGAGNGKCLSNTLFFEETRQWTGVCIEPNPSEFVKLQQLRKCQCVNVAIDVDHGHEEFTAVALRGSRAGLSGLTKHFHPRHVQRILKRVNRRAQNVTQTFQVITAPLQSIIDQHGLAKMDLVSIDVEGAEMSVLQSIDWDRVSIRCLMVENNYHEPELGRFLAARGYNFLRRIRQDEVYVKESLQ